MQKLAHLLYWYRMQGVDEYWAQPRKQKEGLSLQGRLDKLRHQLEQLETCSLKQTATQLVFSDGNPEAKIMCVGEAPGAQEDLEGRPFVGQSGQLLDKVLAAIGLNRNNVYISNIVPWRPPGNRTPTAQEVEVCLPFIEQHIATINPSFLVLLGSVACRALLKSTQSVSQLRGQWHVYKNPLGRSGIRTLVTYHPSYLLRSPGQKKKAWDDFLLLKKELQDSHL